jgi:hypothetical protein
MANKWTRTEAFRFYGTEPRNPNWSWSARSDDAATVSITLWKDEFNGPAGNMTYSKSELGDWFEGPGSRFFFEDLDWATKNCGGLVRVIVAVRDETDTKRVRMAECYPQKNLVMRVTHLDPKKGAFRLEQVSPADVATPVRKVAVNAPFISSFDGEGS